MGLLREATEADFEEIVEISKSDGFEHPNTPTLEWVKNRCVLGDRFYVYVGDAPKSCISEHSENQTKKPEDFRGEELGDIKGFICFQPKFARGSRLHFLSVSQSEQGKGIGSALLEEAEKMSRNHEKNLIYLYVHQKNKKAVNFYLKQGFNFSGIFLDKYGEGENALLMCKKLD